MSTATHDFMEVLPNRGRFRGWAVAFGTRDSHVTYRRARRGPFRGRVQALVEDSYKRRLARQGESHEQ